MKNRLRNADLHAWALPCLVQGLARTEGQSRVLFCDISRHAQSSAPTSELLSFSQNLPPYPVLKSPCFCVQHPLISSCSYWAVGGPSPSSPRGLPSSQGWKEVEASLLGAPAPGPGHSPGAPRSIQERSPTTGGPQEAGVPLWDKACFIGVGRGHKSSYLELL